MKKIKKNSIKSRFATFALVLGISGLVLSGCKKQELLTPTQEPTQGTAQEPAMMQPFSTPATQQAARLAADKKLLEDALKGGLEVVTDATPASNERGTLDTRALINGSIIGHNVAGYQQPFLSAGNNLIAHIAELLKRYEYNISFANGALTATRAGGNTNGARIITIRNGFSTVNYIDINGGGQSVNMPETATIINGSVFANARVIAALAGATVIDWDADTRSLQTFYYEVNDNGIYFYGTQQNSIRTDFAGNQKYITGEPNAFFDPNKPTIIYTHGWQKGGVTSRGREGFLFTEDNQWQNVQNYWRNAGWNVGIFHWIQMADDDWGAMPVDTEKKIYDANSNIGMRWKKSDGSFATRGNPTINVTQMYRQEYLKIAAVASAEIRLIGNSLGGNMTVAMGRELAINGSRLPNRISLMDPYWDGQLNGNDGITVPGNLADNKAVGADGAARLYNGGVAIEYFRSSIAGQQGYNKAVADICAYTNFIPGYTNNPIAKHTQPTRQYLWALAFNPPAVGTSPRTSNVFVRNMMVTQLFWDHTGGTATATPSDDTFTLMNGKP